MDIFIARQPIFDLKQHVVAYELLYRAADEDTSKFKDGDSATSSVVINSLLLMDLENLTDKKLAFINFTKNLIINEVPKVFSKDLIVVEMLEDIIPDNSFIQAVKELKTMGYTIALDDFEADYEYQEMIDVADIIKVDFMLNDSKSRKEIVDKYKNRKIKFLAEKVETHEEFQEAVSQGYQYFQGYFFARPKIVTGKDVRSIALNHIKVLNELNSPDPEYNAIAQIIESDLAMSYKLLRLINSAAFYTNSKITSINHALVMLGFKEIRKWVSLIMLRDMGIDKPQELVRLSLVRAKCMESLAKHINMKDKQPDLFLTGMFSLINTIMDRPMEEVLKELPFVDEVKDALMGKKCLFKDVLNLVICYEKGSWDLFFKKCESMGIEKSVVAVVYIESLSWVNEVLNIS